MSRHWRLRVWALLLFAGLTTSSAFSNPLADLFNAAPKETAAPAPAPVPVREECLLRPGRSAPGQHWVYHLDGHRRCWFQVAEGTVSSRKQVRHHFPKRRVIVSEQNEDELRKVVNARAQLLRSEPADTSRRAATPEIVDAAAGSADEPMLPAPVTPVLAKPVIDQLTPDRLAPRSVDVEMLLAEAPPPAGNTVASSVPAAIAGALSASDPSEDWWERMFTSAGVVLMGLGLVSLLGSLLASLLLDKGAGAIRRT